MSRVIWPWSIKGAVIFIGILPTAFASGIVNALAEVNFPTHASFNKAVQMGLGQDEVSSCCKKMGSVSLDAAIQFALEIGKIESKDEVNIAKSTTGIDSFILRNMQGATIASISKRVLKEKSENAAAAKAKDEFNAQSQ